MSSYGKKIRLDQALVERAFIKAATRRSVPWPARSESESKSRKKDVDLSRSQRDDCDRGRASFRRRGWI